MEVSKNPLGFSATEQLPEGTIFFEITKIQESEQHLVGILKIRALIAEEWYRVYLGQFNITSSRSRAQTAQHIKDLISGTILESVDWKALLEKLAAEAYTQFYEPKHAQKFQPLTETPHVPYLLYPLLPQDVPVLLYAPGGVGKSLVALYISILVQSGYNLNYTKTEPKNVLYVDWELDKTLMEARFNQIVIENLPEKQSPLYLQATHILADEIGDILANVQEHQIQLVVIDSAGMAIGGDINDATAVIKFFQEVRKLTEMGVTVLILTHVAKGEKDKEDGSSPIGSVFFENLARSTWELRHWKHPASDQTYIYGLYNRKSNFGKKEPIGLKVTWEDSIAFIEPADLKAENAVTGATQMDTVLLALKENQALTVNELSQITGINKNRLWVILSDLKKDGLVTNDGNGTWMLKERKLA